MFFTTPSMQHLLHAIQRAGPNTSSLLPSLSRCVATAAASQEGGTVAAATAPGVQELQGLQDQEPSTSGREKSTGRNAKAQGRRKVETTAPWPWVDPSKLYIMPALVPMGKPPPVSLADAIKQVKKNAEERNSLDSPHQKLSGRPRPLFSFDESIELTLRFAADPRKADQVVRGIALLPHGTGKKVRVAVFAKGAEAEEALQEGVEVLGDEQLIQEIIEKGESAVQFDRLVATPAFMKPLARAGRILGPLGLMPNPKVGTLTSEVAKAVRELRAGRCEFRMARDSQIMTVVGKASFPQQKLVENVQAFVTAVVEARPKGLPGQGTEGYIRAAHMKSSMTPAVPIKPETCIASSSAPPAEGARDQESHARS